MGDVLCHGSPMVLLLCQKMAIACFPLLQLVHALHQLLMLLVLVMVLVVEVGCCVWHTNRRRGRSEIAHHLGLFSKVLDVSVQIWTGGNVCRRGTRAHVWSSLGRGEVRSGMLGNIMNDEMYCLLIARSNLAILDQQVDNISTRK